MGIMPGNRNNAHKIFYIAILFFTGYNGFEYMNNSDQFDYDKIVQGALLDSVKKVLKQISKEGLTSNSYFYISFRSTCNGVKIPKSLKLENDDEVTIVLQHKFWDMKVDDFRFSVVLSFDEVRETIEVPFNAITSVVDPYAKFTLQFNPDLNDDGDGNLPPPDNTKKNSNVVKIDFGKKKD